MTRHDDRPVQSAQDARAAGWLVATCLLIVGALFWLLPEQVSDPSDTEQPCVQVALSERGLPPCEGDRPAPSVPDGKSVSL